MMMPAANSQKKMSPTHIQYYNKKQQIYVKYIFTNNA